MSDKSVELLQGIIERLGMETARVWPQVVMVTWITSLFWLVALPVVVIAAAAAAFVVGRSVYREMTAHDDLLDGNPLVIVFGVVGTLFLAMLAIFAFSSIPTHVAGVLFPEAQTVLNIAKGVK